MRQSRTYGSVGSPGEKPPGLTRPECPPNGRQLTRPIASDTTRPVWLWISLITSVVLVGVAAVSTLRRRRHDRRLYYTASRTFLETPAGLRGAAMQRLIAKTPLNAPAWYLYGCECLSTNRLQEAARSFGLAHHCDCNLESAALLTFSCLKASDGKASDIIEQMVITWHEMKRPDPTGRAEDRCVLDCLASASGGAPELSPLGRLIWLVTGPARKSRLGAILASADPRWSVLRTSS